MRRTTVRPLVAVLACSLLLVCASAADASVASYYAAHVYTVSQNWAGHVVKAPGGFGEVSASWRVSSAKCTGPPTDSGTWIGLGGFGPADRLEQIGTDTSCTATTTQFGPGVAYSTAFSEIVPHPQQQPNHVVNPGDYVNASVAVAGYEVTLTLRDVTRHWRYIRRAHARPLDVSTAEWVTEDPVGCFSAVVRIGCPTSPYADFTPLTFAHASARAASSGQLGSISTRGWDDVRVACVQRGTLLAWPSLVSDGGSVFTVTRRDQPAPPEPPPPV
jgi:hypothetical protein